MQDPHSKSKTDGNGDRKRVMSSNVEQRCCLLFSKLKTLGTQTAKCCELLCNESMDKEDKEAVTTSKTTNARNTGHNYQLKHLES